LPFEAGPLEDEVQEAIEAFQSQQNWIQIHAIRQGKANLKFILFFVYFNIKHKVTSRVADPHSFHPDPDSAF
jgi:hypothetical protein